jgi:hypothetical protein
MSTVNSRGYIASSFVDFETNTGGGVAVTTKGDIQTFSTVSARLSVGSDNALLVAKSSQDTGLQWINPVTTKGDLFVFNGTDLDRFAAASNDTILVADSGQASGVKWATLADVIPTTTKGDILGDTGTASGRFPVGTDHSVVTAASGETYGLKWDSVAFTHDIGDGTTNLMCGGPEASVFANIAGGAENNIALGTGTLDAITTGSANIVIGNGNVTTLTTTDNNTIIGYATATTLIGSNNIVIGQGSLVSVSPTTTGCVIVGGGTALALIGSINNTILGSAAANSTTGASNTCIGHGSLPANTSGASNTAVGIDAGQTNTTGSFNTYLGGSTSATIAVSGGIALGYDAVCTTSNTLRVGSAAQPITSMTGHTGNVMSLGLTGNRLANGWFTGNVTAAQVVAVDGAVGTLSTAGSVDTTALASTNKTFLNVSQTTLQSVITLNRESAVADTDVMGDLLFSANADGANHTYKCGIAGVVDGATGGQEGGALSFLTKADAAAAFPTEKLRLTEDGRVYGTALHNNTGSVTGTANQYIASGTYTPTGTVVTNVDTVNTGVAFWTRIGNVVTVHGSINVDATSASIATTVRVALPIASTFAAVTDSSGVIGGDEQNVSGVVSANVANNDFQFDWVNGTVTSDQTRRFTAAYVIL